MTNEELKKLYNGYLAGFDKFFVNDLTPENSEIAFILESPHIEEVKTGKPLSGSSGKRFSRQLFDSDKSYNEISSKYNISIIESSPFPLQLSAYSNLIETINNDAYKMDFLSKFCCLKCIVDNLPDNERKKQLINYVNQLPNYITDTNLYKNFENRIEKVINSKPKTIVLCGLFAQQFFNSYLSLQDIEITDKLQKYIGKIEIDSETIIELIYINHPKDWHTKYNSFNKYVKPKLGYIKSKLR